MFFFGRFKDTLEFVIYTLLWQSSAGFSWTFAHHGMSCALYSRRCLSLTDSLIM